ncbi:hypothetical protein ACFY7Z_17800 [Streptomyces sp. NPDC012623]|uniref:hypothetical protein n=1 Tax=unclassified Streptomyces TaxID=2593676 RepID=UPI0036A8FF1D
MTDSDKLLIVPVQVDALVVNYHVREEGGKGFRRWQPNFNLLRHYQTPEPDPFSNDQWDWSLDEKNDGVYVRWEVPEALRHGAPREPGGRTEFPLVPNRWLVVRHVKGIGGSADSVAGWVVESDYLDAELGTSRTIHPIRPGVTDPTVTPYRSSLTLTQLGRRQDIAGSTGWSEPTGPERKELFLTAVGPGLMTFHAFQPYHQDVFSLHDDLAGLDTGTISYQVIGWHSDPAQEELRRRLGLGGATLEKVLAGLDWKVDQLPHGWTPEATAYCGLTRAVAWDRKGEAPDSDRPVLDHDRDSVPFAFGSSADEASAALLSEGLHRLRSRTEQSARATDAESAAGSAPGAQSSAGRADPVLLHALGRGLLDTLDGKDGGIETAQAMHRGWFEQHPGGYIWRMVDTSDKGNTSGNPDEVTWSGVAAKEEQLLAALNAAQTEYDSRARQLTALQGRLYALWWMHGLPLIPQQYSREQFRVEIDPEQPTGLAAKVAEEQAAVQKLRDAVPHGADAKALALSIQDYLTAHQLTLPPGHELRREALPPFWQPADPTVVISGSNKQKKQRPLEGAGTLLCRLPADILGGVRPGDPFPRPFDALQRGGLPTIVSALLGEFGYLLDPANVHLTPAWRQPWKPLLCQWEVTYWPVPQGSAAAPNWEFDGSSYRWVRGTAAEPHTAAGRRFLVPLPQYTLSNQLGKYAADRSVGSPDAFAAAAAQVKDLDLLSQSLDGLTDALACRDRAPNLSPPGRMGELVGDVYGHLPNPGPLPEPFKGWQPSDFTQIRAGQLALSRLSVVDEFGRTLDVVLNGDQLNRHPVVATSMLPGDLYADKDLHDRFAQLAPRLLQPARLRFDFVNEHNDEQLVDLTADTTPVCAWIVPSYVDRALLCYAPTGAPLGELRLQLAVDQTTKEVSNVVGWGPLPDSAYHTLAALKDVRPRLYSFAAELVARGPAAFLELLSSTGRALTGIDPGNPYGDDVLGNLLGRPLALVRARLGFELDGPPVSDPGWQYALDWKVLTDWRQRVQALKGKAPAELDHLNYQWPVRLGNAGQQGDGLVGYFSEADSTTFYSVATPDTHPSVGYVHEIGSDNWPRLRADSTQRTHLTLLMDPQAAVHATTDLLPVSTLQLPSRFTRTAMSAMSVALRLSPVLTAPRRVPVKAKAVEPGRSAAARSAGPVSAVGSAVEASVPAVDPGFVTELALPHPTSPQGNWDWSELALNTTASTEVDQDGSAGPGWTHQPIVQIDQTARLDEDGPTVRTGYLRLTGGFS